MVSNSPQAESSGSALERKNGGAEKEKSSRALFIGRMGLSISSFRDLVMHQRRPKPLPRRKEPRAIQTRFLKSVRGLAQTCVRGRQMA